MKYITIKTIAFILSFSSLQTLAQETSDSSSSNTGVHYSAVEKSKATLCVGLTTNALTIAQYRLAGRNISDVKNEYAFRPQSQLLLPLVDKVYLDSVSNAWDYSVSFFKTCASNMAAMTPERSAFATYCMQNVIIATIAESYKNIGAPKENAYRYFEKLGDTPKHIIDDVYSRFQGGPQAQLAIWESCMPPFSEH